MSTRDRRTRRALTRREFLQLSGGCVAGATGIPASAVSRASAAATAQPGYPIVDVAPLADLAPGASVAFSYPDASSPALLMRLNESARGGLGDDGSVVAFSTLCTHKGCPVAFRPERGILMCPCHWSTFDPAKGGDVIIGQASSSLPRITLRIDNGMVQAVAVEGLIYGRHTNLL